MHPNFAGALINSALYLVAVFVAAVMSGNRFAWQSAIATMGITYIAHVLQFTAAQTQSPGILTVANVVTWLSILFGLMAGVSLLF
jgi:hypothetical protein